MPPETREPAADRGGLSFLGGSATRAIIEITHQSLQDRTHVRGTSYLVRVYGRCRSQSYGYPVALLELLSRPARTRIIAPHIGPIHRAAGAGGGRLDVAHAPRPARAKNDRVPLHRRPLLGGCLGR